MIRSKRENQYPWSEREREERERRKREKEERGKS
jgi:hypothetical protein